jgi:hypothetical protein
MKRVRSTRGTQNGRIATSQGHYHPIALAPFSILIAVFAVSAAFVGIAAEPGFSLGRNAHAVRHHLERVHPFAHRFFIQGTIPRFFLDISIVERRVAAKIMNVVVGGFVLEDVLSFSGSAVEVVLSLGGFVLEVVLSLGGSVAEMGRAVVRGFVPPIRKVNCGLIL